MLSKPYFRSEEKWSAWVLLIAIIALSLSMVGMNVVLNFWNRMFFNALQAKQYGAFLQLLFTWRRMPNGLPMPGFCEIVAVYIVVAVYTTYLNQWLQIRWRRWLTGRYLDEWLSDQAYYRISLQTDAAAIGTDNPDQRIADDLRDFVQMTLSLGVDFLSNVVNFGSFVGILWVLSGNVKLLGVTIPGYMVWVALLYAAVGTALTHWVGRPLIGLRFRQQRVEADFRYALVRLRENMEGIALYGGEAEERSNLRQRFQAVIANWWGIMIRTKRLNALTAGYGQLAGIFPFVVAAPRYFAGEIELGGLTQTADAFGNVQSSLSWFVNVYGSIAQWSAVVERLGTFHRAIVAARAMAGTGIESVPAPAGAGLKVSGLDLALPDGQRILEGAGFDVRAGESTIITGRSGSGKSTLFRALAGIWPFARGRVERPAGTAMFLPQRPYIPLGTLRHVVTYPAAPEHVPQEDVEQALSDMGLAYLIPLLDRDENWPQRLSGGEQQRIALARALLARPDWLFLDEATANLDPAAEQDVYAAMKKRLPGTSIVSIAHRPNLAAFHERKLVLEREPGRPGHLVAGVAAPEPAAAAGE